MALSVKHAFHSSKGDGPDTTRVKPSDWNAEHALVSDADGIVLGRASGSGVGPIEALPMSALLPAGCVMPYAGATPPSGWLLCYGQTVSRSTEAALFAAIGTVYGAGDGATTFVLPDLRGVALAGLSNMGGSDRGNLAGGNVLGTTIGAQTKTTKVYGQVAVSTDGGATYHLEVNMGYTVPGKGPGQFTGYVATDASKSAGAGEGAGNDFPSTTPNMHGGVGSTVVINGGTARGYGSMFGSIVDNQYNYTTPMNVVQPTIIMNYIIKR